MTSTPLPEQRGCNVPRCGVWPIYKEGLCGSHYMGKHCPREGEYVSKYDPLPEQGGFDEKLDEILRTYTADKEWARTKVENHDDYTEHTNECGVCNKMQQLTDQAKAAIRTLVLEEIIRQANPMYSHDPDTVIMAQEPYARACEKYEQNLKQALTNKEKE